MDLIDDMYYASLYAYSCTIAGILAKAALSAKWRMKRQATKQYNP
jgi:hypothetical protein